MKTYLLAYDLASQADRAQLLEELEKLDAFQLYPGVWRLHAENTTPAALMDRFQSAVSDDQSLYLAEVADSVQRPQPDGPGTGEGGRHD